jgi:hypothetical protein
MLLELPLIEPHVKLRTLSGLSKQNSTSLPSRCTSFFLLALDLSHQTKHINDARSLHDLAVGELVEGHHSASNPFACRWDAHKRARVCATQRRSLCDHVSFGNHSLDREAEVWKALTEPDKAFLKSLNAVRLPLKGKEVNNVGSERFIYRLQIDSVEGVVKASNDRFVVFK